MRKKMYWGLASLIFLIGVVGVYFMLQPDPEPDKKYILPSETENKKMTETNRPSLQSNKSSKSSFSHNP